MLVLGIYLVFGSYTKRATATGVLMPTAGLIRISPSVGGVVIERRVEEGQVVAKGDILFIVADERAFFQPPSLTVPRVVAQNNRGSITVPAGAASARVTDAIDASLSKRLATLRMERTQTEIVARQMVEANETQIAQLEAELDSARLERLLSKKRVKTVETQVVQYKKLTDQSYMSEMALAQKNDELIALQLAFTNTTRGITALERQLSTLKATRDQSSSRLSLELAGIEQREAALSQEVAEVRARGSTAILAPVDGTVTGMIAEPGSTVTNQVLATVVPKGSKLHAFLYLPSRSIGFVRSGQKVLLRYQAYPYQKFGQYHGTVKDVSRAQIGQDQLPEVMPTGTREGLYRITVNLDRQTVTTYGQSQKLIPGMVVDAEILQDKRSLVEWIFEPLIGWAGKR